MFEMIARLGRNMSGYFTVDGPYGQMDTFSAHLSGIDIYPNIVFLHYQQPIRHFLIEVTKGKKEITMIPWEKIDQYLTD
jgi:hypothetical protein